MRLSAIIGFAILLPVLTGCATSQNWKSSLADQHELDICAASLDDRVPLENKKKAALELIQERKIKCDPKLSRDRLKVLIWTEEENLRQSMISGAMFSMCASSGGPPYACSY